MPDVPPILRRIARVVGRTRGVDEYVISHVRGQHSIRSSAASQSATHRRIEVTVYRDLRRGRGAATFTLPVDAEGAAEALTREATFRAARAQGPSWSLPPPSAPARVELADASVVGSTDDAAANTLDLITELTRKDGAANGAAGQALVVAAARATAAAETISVITSRGFASSFARTRLEVDLTLALDGAPPGSVERVQCRARHRGRLALEHAMTAAASRLRARGRATRLSAGRYDLVLMDGALATDSEALPYGWLTCIAAQTSAALERQGLTRYRPGQSIFGDHKPTGDPITIASDGTLPFGWLSRPFGSASEAVRRWPVVRDGVAAGLALDLREAALRGMSPNGGLRNLVIAGGKTELAALTSGAAGRPLLRVEELAWLDADARTGRFSAELGLGYVSRPGAKDVPVYGGALRGNVFALLSRARLSRDIMTSSWYVGPRAMRVADVAVL